MKQCSKWKIQIILKLGGLTKIYRNWIFPVLCQWNMEPHIEANDSSCSEPINYMMTNHQQHFESMALKMSAVIPSFFIISLAIYLPISNCFKCIFFRTKVLDSQYWIVNTVIVWRRLEILWIVNFILNKIHKSNKNVWMNSLCCQQEAVYIDWKIMGITTINDVDGAAMSEATVVHRWFHSFEY